MAVVYTMTFSRDLLERKDQSNINVSVQTMLNFLEYGGADFKHRQQVAASLEYLLSKDTNGIIISAFHQNFVILLEAACTKDFSEVNFEFLALFAQILGDYGINPANPIYPFIQKSIIPLVTLCYKVLNYGSGFIQTNT